MKLAMKAKNAKAGVGDGTRFAGRGERVAEENEIGERRAAFADGESLHQIDHGNSSCCDDGCADLKRQKQSGDGDGSTGGNGGGHREHGGNE